MFNFQDQNRQKWTLGHPLWLSNMLGSEFFGTPENSVTIEFWVSVNREAKYYTETKLRTHVLIDFGQILVMKSDYDFGSVNEA